MPHGIEPVGEILGSEATAAGGGVKGAERVAAVYIFKAALTAGENIGHRNRTAGTNDPEFPTRGFGIILCRQPKNIGQRLAVHANTK